MTTLRQVLVVSPTGEVLTALPVLAEDADSPETTAADAAAVLRFRVLTVTPPVVLGEVGLGDVVAAWAG